MIINKITERLHELAHEGKLSNEDFVQLIELDGSYLNLKTIPNYATENNLSYNGVKKTRQIKNIFGVKWVIDN